MQGTKCAFLPISVKLTLLRGESVIAKFPGLAKLFRALINLFHGQSSGGMTGVLLGVPGFHVLENLAFGVVRNRAFDLIGFVVLGDEKDRALGVGEQVFAGLVKVVVRDHEFIFTKRRNAGGVNDVWDSIFANGSKNDGAFVVVPSFTNFLWESCHLSLSIGSSINAKVDIYDSLSIVHQSRRIHNQAIIYSHGIKEFER